MVDPTRAEAATELYTKGYGRGWSGRELQPVLGTGLAEGPTWFKAGWADGSWDREHELDYRASFEPPVVPEADDAKPRPRFVACITPGCGDEDIGDLNQRTGLCGMCERAGASAAVATYRFCTTCREQEGDCHCAFLGRIPSWETRRCDNHKRHDPEGAEE